jgi:hypothetical protein
MGFSVGRWEFLSQPRDQPEDPPTGGVGWEVDVRSKGQTPGEWPGGIAPPGHSPGFRCPPGGSFGSAGLPPGPGLALTRNEQKRAEPN